MTRFNTFKRQWLWPQVGCWLLMIFAAACATNHPAPPDHTFSTREAAATAVTQAINREDWNTLRGLAKKPEPLANGYIERWAKYPIRVGKLISTETDLPATGKLGAKYSFTLKFKDGTFHPHWLQVVIREQNGRFIVADFWEFGW